MNHRPTHLKMKMSKAEAVNEDDKKRMLIGSPEEAPLLSLKKWTHQTHHYPWHFELRNGGRSAKRVSRAAHHTRIRGRKGGSLSGHSVARPRPRGKIPSSGVVWPDKRVVRCGNNLF